MPSVNPDILSHDDNNNNNNFSIKCVIFTVGNEGRNLSNLTKNVVSREFWTFFDLTFLKPV